MKKNSCSICLLPTRRYYFNGRSLGGAEVRSSHFTSSEAIRWTGVCIVWTISQSAAVNDQSPCDRTNRILVPGGLRELVLTRIHNASHPGINRTDHLLRRQFTWSGMLRDVRRFCKRCNNCQREKGPVRCWYDQYWTVPNSLNQRTWLEHTPDFQANFWSNQLLEHKTIIRSGTNVDGRAARQTQEALGVKKLRSSLYHTQGDGQAKRSIQSVYKPWSRICRAISYKHSFRISGEMYLLVFFFQPIVDSFMIHTSQTNSWIKLLPN